MRKIFIVIGSLDLGGTEKQLLLKLLSLNDKLNFTLIVFSKRVIYIRILNRLELEY